MKKYAAPAAVAVALVVVALLALRPPQRGGGAGGGSTGEQEGDQVEVNLHVMSKCPYGVQAMDGIIPLAQKLGNRLKLNIHYIGREEGGRLTSMHGEAELEGNKIQLCVHEHASYAAWLSFLTCQNRSWREIPEGWERCAREAEVDVEPVRACVEGEQGTELVRSSFNASVEAGARGSPTIFVAGARYSGGRTEEAFGRAICAQYGESRPGYCDDIPPPPSVPVTALVDRRCKQTECNIDEAVAALKASILGAKVKEVDYSSGEGRELYERAELKMLPALIIGSEVQNDEEAFRRVRIQYQKTGDMYVQTLGRFDPAQGEWIPRPEVPVRILSDARCKTRECDVSRFEMFLERTVPGAKITRLDYASDEGRELYKRLVATGGQGAEAEEPGPPLPPVALPLALFGETVTQEDELYQRLRRRFQKIDDEYMFVLGRWDPTAEICDNEVDDDGDRQIDCRDTQCAESIVCRQETKRRLDLFVMSQCPYGVQTLNSMMEVLDNFGRDRSKIDFRVQFIGDVTPSGALKSMHGEAEVQEDLREACAQEHFAKNYAFMDYVACRNKNIRSSDWESCATGPVKADVIRTCSEGEEGQRLLRESFEFAKAVDISGSPGWLLNNRYEMNARDANSIKDAFCERNQQPECANTLTKQAGRPQGNCG